MIIVCIKSKLVFQTKRAVQLSSSIDKTPCACG